MNIFDFINVRKSKRSTFNLSHTNSLSCNFGKLVPFLCEETVPGDTWKCKSDILVRLAPMVFPIMHDIRVTTHYWFVPWRLIWEDFEDFITGGPDGLSTPVVPRLRLYRPEYDTYDIWKVGGLADYLNYPTGDDIAVGGEHGTFVSCLPFRAYQLIYDNFYRDENLIESLDIDLSSGEVTDPAEILKLSTLRSRAWSKDYFTSALPFTQKGPQQLVPLYGTGTIDDLTPGAEGKLPVEGQGYFDVYDANNQLIKLGRVIGGQQDNSLTNGNYLGIRRADGVVASDITDKSVRLKAEGNYVSINGIKVNLAEAGIFVNDIRRSNAIQRWLERNARGGSRYIEALRAHFNVISDDARLQVPEFLGGATTPVTISDVLQTSQTTHGENGSPQAQYAGIGFSFGSVNGFKRYFKERGYIIGIMSIMPKPQYAEGLPRGYHKFSKFDYYFPEFAHLGEQEVFNYELAMRGDIYGTFGYAPRFAEYKYIPSRVHSEFKTTLSKWNLARHYSSAPHLTKEFIECDADNNDLNRVFAVEDASEDHMFVHIRNDIKARRPMPYLPDPSL